MSEPWTYREEPSDRQPVPPQRSQPGYSQEAHRARLDYGMPPQGVPQPGFAPHQQAPQYQPPFPPQPAQIRYAPIPQYAPPPRRRGTAAKVIGGIAGGLLVIIGIAVAANGGHKVQTTGSTAGAGAHGSTKTAGIGSAITLSGNSSGERMAVTVTKVIGDAQPSDEFNTPPSGDRLYAVQFRLADTGTAAYSDAPSNGATVIDSAGQSYQSSLDSVAGCQGFGGTENIAPGSSGLGCIVYEVPASTKITRVQFTLNSGMGPDTGQWNVG